MKQTHGKVDPKLANRILRELLVMEKQEGDVTQH